MTSPGGPGYPGGGGSWSGDDPGFGLPQQPPTPYPQQPPPAYPPRYQPQPAPPYSGGAHAGGAHGRAPEAPAHGPHWGRIGLVAAAGVVVIVAIVFAAMWLFGGASGPVESTKKFFEAVQTENTQAAVAVTCTKQPTLAEQFARAIQGVEGTLGTLDKIDVSAVDTTTTSTISPPPSSDLGELQAADFDLLFAKGSVHGRATLVNEDGKWKVCFVDLQPPKVN
ncbi:MAG: hypothetical protein U0U69_05175 [Acidimicrobiia bacterium]